MATTFVTADYDADQVKEAFADLNDKANTLRSCFSGATAPTSPVVGQLWIDTSATPNILKQWGDVGAGNAWNEIANVAKLSSTMDVNWQQLQNERVHNRASAPTVSAGRDGHIYLLTGDGELYFVDQAVDGVVKKVLAVTAGTTTRSKMIPVASFQLDVTNPPTAATKGTTPTIRGLLFDAANELALIGVRVPSNWSGDADLTLRLTCVLNQAETNGDDIDWSADLVAPSDGGSVTGTSTAAAASTTDIGTNSADGDLIECDITIDYDDATNPVSKGGYLFIEIHRTDLAEVDGVIVTNAELVYTVDGAME